MATLLMHRSRSRTSFDSSPILPLSAPPTTSAVDGRACGIVVVSLLLLGGGAGLCMARLGGGAAAAEPTREASRALGEQPVESVASAAAPVLAAQSEPAAETATCRDTASRCDEWAREGECARNAGFMHSKCCASCSARGVPPPPEATLSKARSTSTPPHYSQEVRCWSWALHGECEKNSQYMRSKCRDACEKHELQVRAGSLLSAENKA